MKTSADIKASEFTGLEDNFAPTFAEFKRIMLDPQIKYVARKLRRESLAKHKKKKK